MKMLYAFFLQRIMPSFSTFFLRSIPSFVLLFFMTTVALNAQVVISEVLPNGTFELKNTGTTTVNISTYWICDFPDYRPLSSLTLVSGSLNLVAGAEVVLTASGLHETDDSELGLYTSSSFSSATALISYLEWGSTGHTRSGLAQGKGIWDGNAAPAFSNTQSLVRCGTGFVAADWKVNNTTPYNETTNGDLSNDGTQPTVLTLSAGNNTVSACVQGTPLDVDYFTFEVPANMVLSAIELSAYTSTNDAFLGIQTGATFTEPRTNTNVANLLGGLVFGAGNVGTNLLPTIGTLQGAMGFVGELPAGQYTIWLNETSTALSCPTFNLVISAPTSNECPATRVFDNQVIDSGTFQASNSITTMNTVSIASGATVVFEAGQEITLNVGFTADATNGGSFMAIISDCSVSPIVESPKTAALIANKISPIEELIATVHPNPTYEEATLSYAMPERQELVINLYNSNGLLMKQLVPRQVQEAGTYTLPIYTHALQTGIYFIDIQTANKRVYRKLSVLK